MKKIRKIIILFTLFTAINFVGFSEYSSIEAKELNENTRVRSINGLRDSSFSVQIMGGGIGSINGVRMGKEMLLKKLLKEARKNIYEYVKGLFSGNKVGTVKVTDGRYISFTPCDKCPWPSLGRN